MKLRDVVLLVIQISCLHGLGLPKFHESLNPAEQVHYFGKEIKHSVPTYEFISPQRVAKQTDDQTRDNGDDNLEYLIDAFGEQITIVLEKNNELISPACVLETSRGNGSVETSPCSPQGKDCVYTGRTNLGNNTWVAATTCTGLHGLVGLPNKTLLIQPIKDRHMSRVRRETMLENPHIIYHYQATKRSSDWQDVPIPNEILARRLQKREDNAGKYIETAVVVDKSLCDFHGEDTTLFVKTVLNIAAHLLLDHGLSTKLYLTINKIIIMDEEDKFPVDRNASVTLNNLCTWKQRWNPRSDSHPHHVDYVILLTRVDIGKNNNSDTTGLSVGTMCEETQGGCSVNQDYGLGTGLTVAHEAGHNLGMMHDGAGNYCEDGVNIMAVYSAFGASAFRWSRCSDEYLDTFLSNISMSECINDRPANALWKPYMWTEVPGYNYSANQQCKFRYGPRAEACLGWFANSTKKDVCSVLVCRKDQRSNCTYFGTPRMDGTDCHDNPSTPKRSWCIQGKCRPIEDPDFPKPVNGGWSEWEPTYGACSRTCDGGVKTLRRYCNNPEPMYGGSDCEGAEVKGHQLCNLQPCKEDKTCSSTMGCQTYGLNGTPHAKVDGSQCSTPDTKHAAFSRCVDGQCMAFGCDGKTDSRYNANKCLFCDGSDVTCEKKHNTFTGHHSNSWYKVHTFAANSSSIVIEQGSGNWFLSVKFVGNILPLNLANGVCVVDGLTVTYQKLNHDMNKAERLEIHGVLHRPIQVELTRRSLSTSGPDAEVDLEYHVPLVPRDNRYTWQCSCASGTQFPAVTCMDQSGRAVEDRYCYIYDKPPEAPLNCAEDNECPGQWSTSSWSSCSATCAIGVRTRKVTCSKSQERGGCDHETKPKANDYCFLRPCNMSKKGSACKDISHSGDCTKDFKIGYEECLTKRVLTRCPRLCRKCVDNPIEYDPACMYEDADNCKNHKEAFCSGSIPATNEKCKKLCIYC